MFTGIIEFRGIVEKVISISDGLTMSVQIDTEKVINFVEGESIAVNGVCLTVVKFEKNIFTINIIRETLQRTNLSHLKIGNKVNLERPIKASSRLSGHIVQGHIDCSGRIRGIISRGEGKEMGIEISKDYLKYCVRKGSIAIDGISLTISKLFKDKIMVAIIPHTLKMTNLGDKAKNDMVNIEVDILGKYIESLCCSDANV